MTTKDQDVEAAFKLSKEILQFLESKNPRVDIAYAAISFITERLEDEYEPFKMTREAIRAKKIMESEE